MSRTKGGWNEMPEMHNFFKTLDKEMGGGSRWESPIPRPKKKVEKIVGYQVTGIFKPNNPKGPTRVAVSELDYPIFMWGNEIPPGLDTGWIIDMQIRHVEDEWTRRTGQVKYGVVPGFPVQVIARSEYSAQLERQQKEDEMPNANSIFSKHATFMKGEALGGAPRTVTVRGFEPFEFQADDSTEKQVGWKLFVKTEAGADIDEPVKLTWKRTQTMVSLHGEEMENWIGKQIVLQPMPWSMSGRSGWFVEIVGAPPTGPTAGDVWREQNQPNEQQQPAAANPAAVFAAAEPQKDDFEDSDIPW